MRRIALVIALSLVAVVVVFRVMRRQDRHAFTFTSNIETIQPSTKTVPNDATHLDDEWPQWRGVHRDGIAGSTDLLEEWPTGGPPLVWEATGLGRGMSSVAVSQSAILTLGRVDGRVRLASRSVVDGSENWSTEIAGGGEPNGTPTIHGNHVFAITREGKIVCAVMNTGEIVWMRDFVKDFGGSVPRWGYSESPLIDDEQVICTPGSDDALVVSLDRSTGETIWKSTIPNQMRNTGHGGAGYSSAVISFAAGVKQIVQMFGGGVISIAPADGATLWGYSRVANSTAVVPTPIVQEDVVFVSSGYGTGAALLKIVRNATGLEPQEMYFHPGRDVQNHHGGMVLVDGYVYLGHGHNRGLPLCLELMTGQTMWGPVRGPGTGSAAVSYADGHLYFRYENARMALIEADPTAYRLKSEFELPSKHGQSWPHPAISQQRLYLRVHDALLCYDLSDLSKTAPQENTAESDEGS